jgi:hypothetical protein
VKDCDAGHILAHRLGGPGNQPINIFPQVCWRSFEGATFQNLTSLLCFRTRIKIVERMLNMRTQYTTAFTVVPPLRWRGPSPTRALPTPSPPRLSTLRPLLVAAARTYHRSSPMTTKHLLGFECLDLNAWNCISGFY